MIKPVYDIVNAGPNHRFTVNGRVVHNCGRIFQPQNLPSRGLLKEADARLGIEALKLDGADLMGYDIMHLASSAIRYAIHAPQGKKLIISDLSAIEGRVLAYLAGEDWKVQAYRESDHDKDAPDLYEMSYAKTFMVDPMSVTRDQRDIGKVLELACLGGDTLVLTEQYGWLPIRKVSKRDRVWDGDQWVSHKGLISRGKKETFDLLGVRITPDHLIKVLDGWVTAEAIRGVFVYADEALKVGRLEDHPHIGLTVFPKSREPRIEQVYDLLECETSRFTILTEGGPMIVHNCGYAGGVGAFVTFATAFGIDLDELADKVAPTLPADVVQEAEGLYDWLVKMKSTFHGLSRSTFVTIDCLKRLWRRGHPATVQLWADAEAAVKDAILQPKTKFPFGNGMYAIKTGTWVRIGLPSGHFLCYPGMKLEEGGKLEFKGVDQFTKKWGKINTFGGKLTENCFSGSTQILTDTGVKKLDAVTKEDRVWDGEEFVQHGGVAYRKGQKTIDFFGVHVTPDHRLLVNGEWRTVMGIRWDTYATICTLWSGAPRDSEDTFYYGFPQWHWDRVYDILDCGPRQRFAVMTDCGMIIAHNCVQAFSRDIFKFGQLAAEEAGYKVILVVHDELVTEVPDSDKFNVGTLEHIMSQQPPWALDLPLHAKGFEDYQYHKKD